MDLRLNTAFGTLPYQRMLALSNESPMNPDGPAVPSWSPQIMRKAKWSCLRFERFSIFLAAFFAGEDGEENSCKDCDDRDNDE